MLGRGSVCINSGGEKIYPEEVEQALKHHPSVYDAVVVGTPNERFGQQVSAVVQARAGEVPSEQELIEFCAQHLARYKLPRAIVYVDEMVRSPSGKADYRWAKKLAYERLGLRDVGPAAGVIFYGPLPAGSLRAAERDSAAGTLPSAWRAAGTQQQKQGQCAMRNANVAARICRSSIPHCACENTRGAALWERLHCPGQRVFFSAIANASFSRATTTSVLLALSCFAS